MEEIKLTFIQEMKVGESGNLRTQEYSTSKEKRSLKDCRNGKRKERESIYKHAKGHNGKSGAVINEIAPLPKPSIPKYFPNGHDA